MTSSSEKTPWFRPELYDQTHVEITTLKAKLPQDAVASVAREVLRRVAERA